MNAPALPAYLQNKTSRGLAQSLVVNLGVGSPPFLSIMGNRFTLIDAVGSEIPVATYDPKIGPYVDCVIVDALERTSKIFYDKPFDPSASQYEPPACWSDNGIAPSRNAATPQSRTCAECPQGAWGSKTSAVSGKGVKACADVQKIAFVYAGFEMPFLLRVPPNSRTNFRGYVHKFVGQQIDVSDVVTRITFEQGGIGTLKFEAVQYIDEATHTLCEKLLAAKATDAMIGRLDQPIQGQLPAPAAQPEQIAHQPAQVQQSAPFVPAQTAAPAASTQLAFAPSATGAAPTTDQPPQQQRRRRRTNAEIQAAGQPAQPQGQPATPQQAPFMPQQSAGAPRDLGLATPAASFGMQSGAAPNADMDSMLNSLFGPAKK